MQIFPAIDIRNGKCVRLLQGDYARETVFGDDPVAMAQRWVDQGADILHLVDLDGAREGKPVNGETIRRIVAAVAVPCQLGGGLRETEHLQEAESWGVQRMILGTRALQDPAWCESMSQTYPGRIVMGLDARAGMVATGGWLRTEELTALDAARRCAGWPLAALVYTDIARDGMLQGPDIAGTRALADLVPFPVIASGGVSSLDDIERLSRAGVAGCIIGRALYEGRLDLVAALHVCQRLKEGR